MELEIGLKITRTRDDITSSTDLRIAKDHGGPVFLSRETETMFILTAFLKGFRREHIDIKINEDGTRISIRGEKPVQEMVLMGWVMLKKDVELRAFKKVFRIPGGIILDRIKAKFNDQESTLTIVMPKLLKGIVGVEIEEVEEARPVATPLYKEEVPEPEIGSILRENADSRTPEDEEEAKEEIAEPKTEDRTSQAVEVFPGRDDDGGGILQEKPEEPLTEDKEETDRNVEEPKIEEEPGESEEAITTCPETATHEEIKPEKEIEEKRIPTQKTQTEEIPELKEQQDISEAENVEEEKTEEINDVPKSTEFNEADTPPSSTHYEEEIHAEPNHEAEADTPQESENPEPAGELPSPDEEEQTETPHPADEPEKVNQDNVQEESPGIGNHEIEEEASDQATVPEGAAEEGKEDGSAAEMERRKENGGGGEEGTSEAKKRKRRTKLCPPIVVAGSAILVSLIVLVINLIRNSSRKK